MVFTSVAQFFYLVLLCWNINFCCSSRASATKAPILQLFISITSGPHHGHLRNIARETWLSICMDSYVCDYRFFIDTYNITAVLAEENAFHLDMTFRDSCDIMRRHPSYIHYGNSPVSIELGYVSDEKPDYPIRRLYKIDWKYCFMKYSVDTYGLDQLPLFHAYVEDDSYNCIDNLLHQTQILTDMMYPTTTIAPSGNLTRKRNPQYSPFRGGFSRGDGFDDSSTFMTKEVVEAFHKYYPSPGFDCMEVVNSTKEAIIDLSTWLSWGNSWRRSMCNWREVLKNFTGLNVITPDINGCSGEKELAPYVHPVINSTQDLEEPEDFPCMRMPFVYHARAPFQDIFSPYNVAYNHAYHMCEYFLFIDKVKEPWETQVMWNGTHFYNCRRHHNEGSEGSRIMFSENNEGNSAPHLRRGKRKWDILPKESTPISSIFSTFLLDSFQQWLFHLPLKWSEKLKWLESTSSRRLLKHSRNEEFEVLESSKLPCDPHMTYKDGLKAHPHVYHNMSNYFIADALIQGNNHAAHIEALAWLEYKKACDIDKYSVKCLSGY